MSGVLQTLEHSRAEALRPSSIQRMKGQQVRSCWHSRRPGPKTFHQTRTAKWGELLCNSGNGALDQASCRDVQQRGKYHIFLQLTTDTDGHWVDSDTSSFCCMVFLVLELANCLQLHLVTHGAPIRALVHQMIGNGSEKLKSQD